jgi:hypothetical protein
MRALLVELFDLDGPESSAERVHLHVFELCVVGLTLMFVWQWARAVPHIGGIAHPLGLARWLDLSFMFNDAGAWLCGLVFSVCALLALGTRLRAAYLPAFVLMHLVYVARHGLGKVGHGSSLTGIALLGLALGALLERDVLRARRFALVFSVFWAAVGYTSAALCKLLATGPQWIDGRHLALWITERGIDGLSAHGALQLSWLQHLLVEQRFLATALLAFGLLAEACGVLALWRRPRPYVFAALLAMHFGVWLSMDILFEANIALVILIGFPWPRLWLRLRELRDRDGRRVVTHPEDVGA